MRKKETLLAVRECKKVRRERDDNDDEENVLEGKVGHGVQIERPNIISQAVKENFTIPIEKKTQ